MKIIASMLYDRVVRGGYCWHCTLTLTLVLAAIGNELTVCSMCTANLCGLWIFPSWHVDRLTNR